MLVKSIVKAVLIGGALATLLAGCAKNPSPLSQANGKQAPFKQSAAGTVTANVGYSTPTHLAKGDGAINQIRLKALRETATQLGARGALAWRSLQIDNSLEKQANYLDSIFNFNQLLINGNVLPPVIVESNNSLNLASNDAIRTSSKTYRIISHARFVTTAPTWRTYLWMNYKKPGPPNQTLLPTTKTEAAVWNTALKKGWKEGLVQANEIFATNLNRLKRDYMGIVLYRKLLDEHMISSPYVAQSNLGVTGNANVLHIDDRVERITAKSALQPDSSKWNPVLTH